ncbi:MAG: AI-2E family transporter [Nanoarchaeota archaeon]
MDEKDFKKFLLPFVLLLMGVLSYLVVKPILTAIILGLLFAYMFTPAYRSLNRRVGSKNISATMILLAISIILILPIILMLPLFTKQLFEVYSMLQQLDVSGVILQIFPTLASNPGVSTEIISAASHFNSNLSNLVLSIFQNTLLNLPSITFSILILLFTFFFALREGDSIWGYFTTIFPFPKEYHDRFYQRFSQVTDSVIYGHVIIGIAQGIIAGIGYYMFGIPNALLLTILTIIVGVIPVIGPWLVWVPVDGILFITGNTVAGMQLLIYGLFLINWIDTIARPIIVAERAEMNSALALIGVIGGTYAFGAIGFLLGPLILATFILMIELYRSKDTGESIVIKEASPPPLVSSAEKK